MKISSVSRRRWCSVVFLRSMTQEAEDKTFPRLSLHNVQKSPFFLFLLEVHKNATHSMLNLSKQSFSVHKSINYMKPF